MKRLLLLRHAEAEAARDGVTDFDRTLTVQGRNQALDAAQRLKETGIRVDAVLISPAVRARETAVIVAAQLDYGDGLHYDPALYLGAAAALLPSLQRCHATAQTVLMVGHNPGLSALARQLAGDPGNDEQPFELRTGALCRIEFEADSWSGLAPEAVTSVSMPR